MTKPSWNEVMDDRRKDGRDLPANHPINALARLGKTEDGQVLLQMLKAKMNHVPDRDASESALREDVAEKRLAQKLIQRLEPNFDHTSGTRKPAARGHTAGHRRV
jgi:hypothetical protein